MVNKIKNKKDDKKKLTYEENIGKIREMIQFLVKDKISNKLKELNAIERKIYELTGEKGQTEIVRILKTAPNTISNTWKKLEIKGILIKEGTKYRKVI